jgi:hypothetical protein
MFSFIRMAHLTRIFLSLRPSLGIADTQVFCHVLQFISVLKYVFGALVLWRNLFITLGRSMGCEARERWMSGG